MTCAFFNFLILTFLNIIYCPSVHSPTFRPSIISRFNYSLDLSGHMSGLEKLDGHMSDCSCITFCALRACTVAYTLVVLSVLGVRWSHV